ncbi:VOC family protein, partial [Gordonia sp. VNK21]|uniref:VOC family protein n=1 Tax=Gordonia sp. VNK21 TaxID=3382483 RepID=UPI0038D44F50
MKHAMIFVNLPVADLAASRAFFEALGYTFDERFSDENAAGLILGDTQVAMLLRRDFYQTFVPDKQVADARSASEVLVCLSAESRDEVDALADGAVAAGASAGRTEDHGRGVVVPVDPQWLLVGPPQEQRLGEQLPHRLT